MGLDDLLEQLRTAMRERLQDVHLRDAFSELRERLEDLLDDERDALDGSDDPERAAEKRARLGDLSARVSEALEQLRDYDFESPDAKRAFDELVEELQNIRDLEDFQRKFGEHLHGERGLSFEEAVDPCARWSAGRSSRTRCSPGSSTRSTPISFGRSSGWRRCRASSSCGT
jgi:hypothetical protein